MIKKVQITPSMKFELTQTLHVAVLDAIMASRRWEPGELVFQGGTSLHLAYGSPRYSEDLDFIVGNSLDVDGIGKAIENRLKDARWIPAQTELYVTREKVGHNPITFDVRIGGENVINKVRVKVEFWQADPEAVAGLRMQVAPVRLNTGPEAGMQAFVPTADLFEILADKVFAVVARDRLKPRDVFDLHWLSKKESVSSFTVDQMRMRLLTYPNTSVDLWLEKAFECRRHLMDAKEQVQADLHKWLPSSWRLSDDEVEQMLQTTLKAVDCGIDTMRVIRDERELARGGLER